MPSKSRRNHDADSVVRQTESVQVVQLLVPNILKSSVLRWHFNLNAFYPYPLHPLPPHVRFTNATDTVMCVGVETTTVAEVAIDHGRCVECFILEEDARASLEKKITDAFRTAHGRGLFQVIPRTLEDRISAGKHSTML